MATISSNRWLAVVGSQVAGFCLLSAIGNWFGGALEPINLPPTSADIRILGPPETIKNASEFQPLSCTLKHKNKSAQGHPKLPKTSPGTPYTIYPSPSNTCVLLAFSTHPGIAYWNLVPRPLPKHQKTKSGIHTATWHSRLRKRTPN